jgi:hypothetical protein
MKSLKKADLRKGPETLSVRDKWRVVVPKKSLEVVSLLTTCRKGEKVGDEGGDRRAKRVGCLRFSLYFLDLFFK